MWPFLKIYLVFFAKMMVVIKDLVMLVFIIHFTFLFFAKA